jgi:signal transduction histidine kinase
MSPSIRLGERMEMVPLSPIASKATNGQPHTTPLNGHTHAVQFYETDAALLDELDEHIGSALEAGDAAVVVATEAHRLALDEHLRARGLDMATVATEGRYLTLDAGETLARCVPNGWPDVGGFFEIIGDALNRATAAATGKHPHVAVFGELVALLAARGQYEAAICLEELWNDLANKFAFSLHCGYPIGSFDRAKNGDPIARICAAHTRVMPGESYVRLVDETQHGGTIALLQQKARALESEVAERKRVEAELRERNRDLSAALAAREEFLSVAAHELKTPLTTLRAYAQLLLRDRNRERGVPPERLETALTAIDAQTRKLDRLLTRLLDVTQIEAGQLRVEPVRTDLAALVRSEVDFYHAGDAHDVVVNGPQHLDALVDPVRFEHVVTNLLDNAVKFSPRGGTVTVELGHDDDGKIRLSVTDQGVGVPPEQREAVFGRFYQAHGGPHLSGLGLGLFIAQEIVGLHGGTVCCDDPGHAGARFTVSLPPVPDPRIEFPH